MQLSDYPTLPTKKLYTNPHAPHKHLRTLREGYRLYLRASAV